MEDHVSLRTIAQIAPLCALLLWGATGPLAAQDTPADPPPLSVQVTFAGFTLTPDLSEDGQPVLDEDGQPVMTRLPLDDSVITPGDQVLYVITLDNPTDETATALAVAAQIPATMILDPFSITGPEGLHIAWADEENPTNFRPVFDEIDGQEIMAADLDLLRALRLTLPEL
ncbi:MAG: hypothetical protein EA339_13970, partial [Rhodobacteraceae bacterium]